MDFGNRRIRLGTRKRGGGSLEYDWLPMTGELFEALRWWQEHRTFPRHTHVFVCEQEGGFCAEQYGKPFKERMHFMRTLCERARVRPFGFHAIRHLTASILYRLGQPVSVIQAILRHKSPNTTALYLKSLGREETRGALESLSARHANVTHSFAATTAAGQGSRDIPFPSPDGEKAVVRIRRKTA